MQDVVEIQIWQFCLIYILLMMILFIMKKCHINQTKLLMVAGFRMTVQLTIAGFVLTYIFENPHPVLTIGYLICMIFFAVHRVLSKNDGLNVRFKLSIAASLSMCGVLITIFFVTVIVGQSIFNPQYIIPLSGMIIGNAMTGITLGIKTFREGFDGQKNRIETLLNIGVSPQKILLPFVNRSIETALLPNLNLMLGMGIVSLPGMMTGQILSGTSPKTAILYQISIMIAIAAVVCLSVFCALYAGYRTMYNSKNQITLD